jgi:hypothetical protein
MVEPLRVGIYARISTHDQQTLPLQVKAMRQYARRRSWKVVKAVEDVGSGASERPQREELIKAARRRQIDAILVWRLDRWGRSLLDLIGSLQELSTLGVGFVSLCEALDLTTPSGRALAGILAVFAEYAEPAVMRRDAIEVEVWPARWPLGAPHNIQRYGPQRFRYCGRAVARIGLFGLSRGRNLFVRALTFPG